MGMRLQRTKRWHNALFCNHETERNKPAFDAKGLLLVSGTVVGLHPNAAARASIYDL